MDNARIHLNSNDFNPKDTKRKREDLLKYASDFFGGLWGFRYELRGAGGGVCVGGGPKTS